MTSLIYSLIRVMEYITLQDLQKKYKVSSSTARRVYRKLRDDEKAEYKGYPVVKKEDIERGNYKIFLMKDYLEEVVFGKGVQGVQTSDQAEQPKESQGALDLLREQLKQKDIQIRDQAEQLKEFHKEFQHFQELEQKIIERYTDMQQQLEQKNEEIKRLQAVAVHRQTLLEQYTQKAQESENKGRIRVDFDQVEEADQVEVEEEPAGGGEDIDQRNERTFMEWITSTQKAK